MMTNSDQYVGGSNNVSLDELNNLNKSSNTLNLSGMSFNKTKASFISIKTNSSTTKQKAEALKQINKLFKTQWSNKSMKQFKRILIELYQI